MISRFRDRIDAGRRLAVALKRYKGQAVVVYGIPRGGAVIADEIARYLHALLDLIITRKIVHPMAPEYAIGAIAENGHHIFSKLMLTASNEQRLQNEIIKAHTEAQRRRVLYLQDKQPISAKNKIAMLVDDGIATGLTIRVSIRELKHQQPKKIIVAIPVIPKVVARQIKPEVGELISLITPQDGLSAVGAYYEKFPQVTDAEVVAIMKAH